MILSALVSHSHVFYSVLRSLRLWGLIYAAGGGDAEIENNLVGEKILASI